MSNLRLGLASLIISLGAFTAQWAMAQHSAAPGAQLASLSLKLGILSERAAYIESPDRALFEKTHDLLLSLQKNLERSGKEVPEDYIYNLNAYQTLLPRTQDVTSISLDPLVISHIVALNADLAVKNRYLTSGMGATSFTKELLVMVKVRTRRPDGTPVTGYEVLASPVAMPSNWTPIAFSSPTNVADKRLAPGIYRFTFRGHNQVFERQPIEIGDEGLPIQEVWQEAIP